MYAHGLQALACDIQILGPEDGKDSGQFLREN